MRFVLLVVLVTAFERVVAQPWQTFDVLDSITQSSVAEFGVQASEELWFDQLVEHFDYDPATFNKTWKQRYFLNKKYFGGRGSPVFLLLGGELPVSSILVTSKALFINELAQKFKALIVCLEHRYYGKSQPTPDYSLDNLKYLRSIQAIADIATFQDYLYAAEKLTMDSKWIAFGGRYGGSLAAWSRLLLNDRFAGAVASSAPLQGAYDFGEYTQMVHKALRYFGNDTCTDVIFAATTELHNILTSAKPQDEAYIKELFHLCCHNLSEEDKLVLESRIVEAFASLAVSNDVGGQRLKAICAQFTAQHYTPLQKLARFMNSTSTQGKCLETSYSAWIDACKNESLSSTLSARQWGYQLCSEFGFGQSTKGTHGAFAPLKFLTADHTFGRMCADVYKISNTSARVGSVNEFFGGLAINASNVLFTSGAVDPWTGASFTNLTTPKGMNSRNLFIQGASHCRDMYASQDGDSGHVVWAHQEIVKAINQFLHKRKYC